MSSVNTAIIMGRVGQEPKINHGNNDSMIANFSVATSRKVRGEEKTVWHNVRAFNKTAQVVSDYVNKGDLVHIEGMIENGSYEKDGQTRYFSQILVNKLTLLPKGSGQGGQSNNRNQSQAPAQSGGGDDFSDDIPFSPFMKGEL